MYDLQFFSHPHFVQVGLDMKLNGLLTVADAEKMSLVFLRPVGNFVVVYLPFVMLRVFQSVIARSAPTELQFPSDLLLSPTANRPWSWQDFEMILPYTQAALCNSICLIDPARLPRSVQLLLRGGVAKDPIMDLRIAMSQMHVYFEAQQYAESSIVP